MKNHGDNDALRSRDETLDRQPAEVPGPGLRRRWSTTFLIAGSALLGATAIAFWNRRTLANMRAQLAAERPIPPAPAEAEDEII